MPLTFAQWAGNVPSFVATQHQARAAVQWARIQDKATDIQFVAPDETVLPTQTVRLEWDDAATEEGSAAGMAGVRKLTIFGIHGHAELDDTDIDRGYIFVFEDRQYTVIDVVRTIGQVQARAEAVG